MAFVPEGQADRSLARSAWDNATPKNPSRRVRCDWCRCAARRFDDWSEEISNPKTENIYIVCGISCARSYRTLRDGFFGGTLSQALRAWLRSCCPSGTKHFRPPRLCLKSALFGKEGFVRRKLRFASVNLGGVYQVPWQHFGPRTEICPSKCPNCRALRAADTGGGECAAG
jgi:hypothetical protein